MDRTHSCLESGNICEGVVDETYMVSPKYTFLEMLHITSNGPEHWNGIWNYLSLYEHITHVSSENDRNSIGKEIITWNTSENIH